MKKLSKHRKRKYLQQLCFYLPAISTMVYSIGKIWGFDNVEEIVVTINAINVFVGYILAGGKSNEKTNGEVVK